MSCMNHGRQDFQAMLTIRSVAMLLAVSASCAVIGASGADGRVVALDATELTAAFKERRTVVLIPGKVYRVVPPLIVNGVLDCRGATIAAASPGRVGADDPKSSLLVAVNSTVMNGTLDCRGLVNSGIYSRGELRALDLRIVDYRRKGIHAVHGPDNRPVDTIIVDDLVAQSRKLDSDRTGPAFQYDSSKPLLMGILNRIRLGPHKSVSKPLTVFKVAHVERLFADRIDAGGARIVFGENVGTAWIRVKNLYHAKGGGGLAHHPDPRWSGSPLPRKLTLELWDE